MSEAELQSAVVDMLTLYGWKWHHETDSRKSKRGFPDFIAAHTSGRLMLIELKGYNSRGRLGKVTVEQQQWLDVWRQVGAWIDGHQISSHAWKPENLHSGAILRALDIRKR
ncbi:VRR-NUC domain-containing protein [Nesterenkonia sphaerica]|nr:VRR-NUC domain-containing protein [Nesterenkonia sphaerica]